MKRKILYILLALVMLTTIGYFYLNNVFFPVTFKQIVENKAKEYLKRPVTIGKISFLPVQGFIIQDVKIYEPNEPGKLFFKVDWASFNILFAPILKNKTIIIPTIRIKSPYAHIIHHSTTAWNFSDLISPKAEPDTSKEKPNFNFIVRKFVLEDADLDYTDQTQPTTFNESVKDINLNISVGIDKHVRYNAYMIIPEKNSSLETEGDFDYEEKTLKTHLAVKNIHAAAYAKLFLNIPGLTINDGFIRTAIVDLTYTPSDIQTQGNLTIESFDVISQGSSIKGNFDLPWINFDTKNQRLNLKAKLISPKAEISLIDGKQITTALDIDLQNVVWEKGKLAIDAQASTKNSSINLSVDQKFKGDISAKYLSIVQENDSILVKGNFSIPSLNFDLNKTQNIAGDFTADNLLLSSQKDKITLESTLQLHSGTIILSPDQKLSGTIEPTKIKIDLQNPMAKATAQGKFKDLLLDIAPGQTFTGDPAFDFQFEFNTANSLAINYTGTIDMVDDNFAGAPTVGDIQNITGKLLLKTDNIKTPGLAFNIKNTPINILGTISHFADPNANLDISSDKIDLSGLKSLFPDLFDKNKIDINGLGALKAKFIGRIKAPLEADTTATIDLSGASVITPDIPKGLTSISGNIKYAKDLISWDNLRGDFQEKTYTLNGQLKNFSKPVAETVVSTTGFYCRAQVNILNQAFQITQLAGNYLNSTFDIKGDVHLNKDSDPDLDLRLNLLLDTDELLTIARVSNPALHNFKADGKLKLEGLFRGKPKDWRNWEISLTGESKRLNVLDIPIDNLGLKLGLRDNHIDQGDLVGQIYGGDLTIKSTADLRGTDVPINATIQLSNLDLAILRDEKKVPIKELSGKVNLSSSINGPALKLEGLKGDGTLSITDGYIWKLDFLEGIGSILLIPEFKDVAFTEAHADFLIKNKQIVTENAELIGSAASLKGQGSIDFDQNINFKVIPKFNQIPILQSDSMKKGITTFLTQTDGYLEISLKGRLPKLEYKVESHPLKVLKETTEMIKEGVKSVLEGIFNQ